MNVAQLPDCCGILVLNKFKGGHPGSDPDDCVSPEEVGTYLKTQEQEYYGKRAGLMAVLSAPQNKQIGHVFEERLWKILLDGAMNPRTGTKLYMYYRDLNPTEARRKRIFGK